MCDDCRQASSEGQALLESLAHEPWNYHTLCQAHRDSLLEKVSSVKPSRSKSNNDYSKDKR